MRGNRVKTPNRTNLSDAEMRTPPEATSSSKGGGKDVFRFGSPSRGPDFTYRHPAPAGGSRPPPWDVAADDPQRQSTAPRKRKFDLVSDQPPKPDVDDFISFNASEFDDGAKRGDRLGGSRFDRSDEVKSLNVANIELPTPFWIQDPKDYPEDPSQMFQSEVEDFVRYISPMDAEHAVRLLTVQRIKRVVAALWPSAEVKIFGSFETMLYLPTSDIDIVILDDSIIPKRSLATLAQALKAADICRTCETVENARVPLVKYTDSLTQFPVDVSFNMEGGPMAADMVKQLLSDKTLGNGVKGLMYLMKQFLAQRNLNEVFSGGLGSYGLLLFVTAFLKLHPLVQTGEILPEENIGVLFIELLEFSNKFDYDNIGIHFTHDMEVSYFLKTANPYERRKLGALTIIDPLDESNVVTGGSFNFFRVKSEMFRAYNVLVASIASHYERRKDYEDELYDWKRARREEGGYYRNSRHSAPTRPSRPNTILGTIISVRKDLFLVRNYREELATDLTEGKLDDDGGDWEDVVRNLTKAAPPVVGKRKRDESDDEGRQRKDEGEKSSRKSGNADKDSAKKRRRNRGDSGGQKERKGGSDERLHESRNPISRRDRSSRRSRDYKDDSPPSNSSSHRESSNRRSSGGQSSDMKYNLYKDEDGSRSNKRLRYDYDAYDAYDTHESKSTHRNGRHDERLFDHTNSNSARHKGFL